MLAFPMVAAPLPLWMTEPLRFPLTPIGGMLLVVGTLVLWGLVRYRKGAAHTPRHLDGGHGNTRAWRQDTQKTPRSVGDSSADVRHYGN
jgi:hypothetical protein